MVWSQSEEDIFKTVTDVSFVRQKYFSGNSFIILDLMVTLKTKMSLEHQDCEIFFPNCHVPFFETKQKVGKSIKKTNKN